MISKHPYRAERRACWSTCVAVAVLVGIYMVAGILLADAARATGNERSDKCLTDSSHQDQHLAHHFYGWGHCKPTPSPTTGGPGPTPTWTPSKTPTTSHSATPSKTPKSNWKTSTSSTTHTTSSSPSASSPGSTEAPTSATSDTRSTLPNTGWPLGAWGVVFAVLVACGAACFVSAWAARRGGRA